MANYKEQSISIGGNVERRNPIKMNLDAFASAINKIDERREKTLQQKNAIKAAIGQAKLNAAEDEWKANYIAGIENKINSAAMFGDMSQAYDTALGLAGDAASDPALLGRVRANEKYEKELNTINSRSDLDSITKQRWADENKYYYEDIYDSDHKIIGGTEWSAHFNPVADKNIAQYQALAASIVAEKSGGSSSQNTTQILVDSNGNETKDFNKAADVKLTKTTGGGSTWHKKEEQDLIDSWNSLVAQEPDLVAALKQKYDNFVWAVNKAKAKSTDMNLTEEERNKALADASYYESKLTDRNGFVYTDVEEWSKATILPQFKRMAYNNVTTNSVNSTTYNESFFANKRQQAANASLARALGVTEEQVGVLGSPIAISLMQTFDTPNIDEISQLINGGKQQDITTPFYLKR